MAVKKEQRLYGAVTTGNYAATYIGMGDTLEKAFEDLREGLYNASEEPIAVESVTFYQLLPIAVKTETATKITPA